VLYGQNTDSKSWASQERPKEAKEVVDVARWRRETLLPTMREVSTRRLQVGHTEVGYREVAPLTYVTRCRHGW
jgi:hypothetical protein